MTASELSDFIRIYFSHLKVKLFKNEPHKKILNHKWQVIHDLGLPPGSPDLIGWNIETGITYGVELKTENDKLSKIQIQFLNLMVNDNCIVYVAKIENDKIILIDWKNKTEIEIERTKTTTSHK